MIAHLFRLIWNRKRSQGLVLGEILVSFLVLCMVCTTIAYFVHNARKPLDIDLMHNPAVRRHHSKITERHLTPGEKTKAFSIARVFDLDVALRRGGVARLVGNH